MAPTPKSPSTTTVQLPVKVEIHQYWPHATLIVACIILLVLVAAYLGYLYGSSREGSARDSRLSRQQRKNDHLIHSVRQVFADAGMKMNDAAGRKQPEEW